MKKSYVVIGLGRFGFEIVRSLEQLKCDVLAIDIDKDRVEKMSEFTSHCVICDSTKLVNLKELGLSNVDCAVVAIGGNLQATILTTINLNELGIKEIRVRVDETEYISVMERLGATSTIIPEVASAQSLAHAIVSDTISDYYGIHKEYGVVQINVVKEYKQTALVDLDSRNKFDINIIGIIRNDKFFIPKGVDTIQGDDTLVVVGKNNNIKKFDSFIND